MEREEFFGVPRPRPPIWEQAEGGVWVRRTFLGCPNHVPPPRNKLKLVVWGARRFLGSPNRVHLPKLRHRARGGFGVTPSPVLVGGRLFGVPLTPVSPQGRAQDVVRGPLLRGRAPGGGDEEADAGALREPARPPPPARHPHEPQHPHGPRRPCESRSPQHPQNSAAPLAPRVFTARLGFRWCGPTSAPASSSSPSPAPTTAASTRVTTSPRPSTSAPPTG